MAKIDLNCDMGESFGNYTIGSDQAVMPYISSANIAAGYHAGDPHVMKETVELAAAHDVNVGLHPGLPDLMGYGRRKMDVSPEELHDFVIYQLGALNAFAEQQDIPLVHVKPHGAMVRLVSEADHAKAVLDGIHEVDEDLIYLAPDREIYEHAQNHPIRAVFEGYVDLRYRPTGKVVIEQEKDVHDPEEVADRFVTLATDGQVEAINGEHIDMPVNSICVHGDNPNVVEILEAIHRRIDSHDIELAGLDELV